jgi:hypothetical protein
MQKLVDELLNLLEQETKEVNYLVESFILANKQQSDRLILELLKENYNLPISKLAILNTQALPYIPDVKYLDVLKKMFFHKNCSDKLRYIIIQKIGWRGKYAKSLIQDLVKILESNSFLKGITSISLSELDWEKKEILIPNLIEALSQETDHNVRMSAARQLTKYDSTNSEVLPAIITAMETDPDFRVRQKMAHYIGELERKETIPNLEKAVKNDKHTIVRSVASRVLKELKEL